MIGGLGELEEREVVGGTEWEERERERELKAGCLMLGSFKAAVREIVCVWTWKSKVSSACLDVIHHSHLCASSRPWVSYSSLITTRYLFFSFTLALSLALFVCFSHSSMVFHCFSSSRVVFPCVHDVIQSRFGHFLKKMWIFALTVERVLLVRSNWFVACWLLYRVCKVVAY